MNNTISKLLLNDGNQLNQIGIISFQNDSPILTKKRVNDMLLKGIRHFEITDLFGNGQTIVESLIHAKIPRKDIYITLKIWSKSCSPNSLLNYCKSTLLEIGLDYIDLLILHDPIDSELYIELWRSIEIMKEEGYAKSLGVSKLSVIQLLELLRKCSIPPAVFQMEVSPFNRNADIVDFCDDNAIKILSVDVFSKGMRANHKILNNIAKSLGIDKDKLLVRWACSKNFSVLLPINNENLGEDYNQLTEPLNDDIIKELDELDEGLSTSWIPAVVKEHMDD